MRVLLITLFLPLVLVSCSNDSGPTRIEHFDYEKEGGTRYQFQAAMDEWLVSELNGYTDPDLREMMAESRDVAAVTPDGWFAELIEHAETISYDLGEKLNDSNPDLVDGDLNGKELRSALLAAYDDASADCIASLDNRFSSMKFKYNMYIGEDHRIVVEVEKGVDEKVVMNAVFTKANIEFMETANLTDVYNSLIEIDQNLYELDSVQNSSHSLLETDSLEQIEKNPLFTRLMINVEMGENGYQLIPGPILGRVKPSDSAYVTLAINEGLSSGMFGFTGFPVWGKLMFLNDTIRVNELYLCSPPPAEMKLMSSDIQNSKVIISQYSASPEIHIRLTEQGSEKWAKLTQRNIGKCVAIMIDGVIQSVPMVQEKISGGVAVITGNFTKAEADELCMAINAGAMPYSLLWIK